MMERWKRSREGKTAGDRVRIDELGEEIGNLVRMGAKGGSYLWRELSRAWWVPYPQRTTPDNPWPGDETCGRNGH
jgi:hypothetical protein